ncbi:head-to-tail adaptor [Mycobacterium phage Thonko]|uniref:Head-to-tail adaptor n=1 Tax=Mycobacterium phage Thonko TaxID=2282910 RepID=A0A346FC68_9CAUD|nr:head-tail adaptor [Mycobacterium phage Thonko]AXN53293.1 head-to-tail adaptor [Mycobacterium phage Thonko]
MSFDWPIDRDCLPPLPAPDADDYDDKLAERSAAEDMAVSVLWALSGRQFGIRDVTVRPCIETSPINHHGSGPLTSYVLSWEGDRWVNWWCGCIGGCRRSNGRAVHLPGPVVEVTRVEVNGVDLPSNVWVEQDGVLYRRETTWPRQDLGRPLGEVNTWAVHYRRGQAVPPNVEKLTGVLAREFIRACDDNSKCRLPRTVTTASRQGVTYRVYDPAKIYADGKTNIPEIDQWLAAVNPHHLMQTATVL